MFDSCGFFYVFIFCLRGWLCCSMQGPSFFYTCMISHQMLKELHEKAVFILCCNVIVIIIVVML